MDRKQVIPLEVYFRSSWMVLMCQLEDIHGRDEVKFTCWVSERHTHPCHGPAWVTLGRRKGWVTGQPAPVPTVSMEMGCDLIPVNMDMGSQMATLLFGMVPLLSQVSRVPGSALARG